jgi:hypothetical protein
LCGRRVDWLGFAVEKTKYQKDSNTLQITRRKVPIDLDVGAESGAVREVDSDLERIVAHWPTLPPSIKRVILLMVDSTTSGKTVVQA